MPKDQRVYQGRWKFWKGSVDTVGQFDEKTVGFFFNEGRYVLSEILAERNRGACKCRVLTKTNVARYESR